MSIEVFKNFAVSYLGHGVVFLIHIIDVLSIQYLDLLPTSEEEQWENAYLREVRKR